MNNNPKSQYEILLEKYGSALDRLGVSPELLGDVIEIWEDFERLHPMLTSIMELDADDEEFRSIMLTMLAWSWHTSDHLRELYELLSDGDDGHD